MIGYSNSNSTPTNYNRSVVLFHLILLIKKHLVFLKYTILLNEQDLPIMEVVKFKEHTIAIIEFMS